MGVEVVLIPNIHLETPNYNIVRIKHDDVNQETSRASYKMVELPAETSYLPNPAEEAKAVKAVAAVKGITPAAPAPIVAEKAEAKVSIIAKIKAFFANLGNKTKTEKSGEKSADSRREGGRNRNRNRNRNRAERNDRPQQQDRGNRNADVKAQEPRQAENKGADNKNQDGRNQEPRQQKPQQQRNDGPRNQAVNATPDTVGENWRTTYRA